MVWVSSGLRWEKGVESKNWVTCAIWVGVRKRSGHISGTAMARRRTVSGRRSSRRMRRRGEVSEDVRDVGVVEERRRVVVFFSVEVTTVILKKPFTM